MRTTLIRTITVASIAILSFLVVLTAEPLLRLWIPTEISRFTIAVLLAFIIIFGLRSIEHAPYAVLLWLIYTGLTVSTPILGPPGVHKLLCGLIIGISVELSFQIFGRSRWAYIVTGGIMCAVAPLSIIGVCALIGINSSFVTTTTPHLPLMASVGCLTGGLGALMGYTVFNFCAQRIPQFKQI